MLYDVLPSSLIDSNMSLKWKQQKNKELGHTPSLTTLWGLRSVLEFQDGDRKKDKQSITHTNQTTDWLVHGWNTFGARTSHGQIRTHKTHHDPNLGKTTTFPLIVYYVAGHRTNIQMAFCPETPKWESQNSQHWESCNFEGPYLCMQTSDWNEVSRK
jgi:hypothetical protein